MWWTKEETESTEETSGQGIFSGIDSGEETEDANGIGGVGSFGEETDGEAVEETLEPEAAAEETTTSTTVPDEVPGDDEGGFGSIWLWAALAVVLALLIALAVDTVRRKNQKKRRRRRPPQAKPTTVKEAGEPDLSGTAPTAVTAAAASATIATPADVPPAPLSIRAAVFQDVGARDDQQDSYGMTDANLYAQQGVMAVVADGMGGLSNGKAVSSALVRTFLEGYGNVSYSAPQEGMLELALRANAQINQMLQGQERSGSTLISAMIRSGYLHFLTVGDSRLYLYRSGVLLQLNREHIYQEELAVKAINRMIPLSQVRGDRQAHSLTSYFGIGRIPAFDRNDEGIKLIPGDRILLCSDGVFGTLTQEQMEEALTHSVSEAAKLMGEMVRQADKPYQDNNTGLILEYLG